MLLELANRPRVRSGMADLAPILLTEEEAAQLLRCGLTKFRQLGIPCIKARRWKRYRREALEDWARKNEQ